MTTSTYLSTANNGFQMIQHSARGFLVLLVLISSVLLSPFVIAQNVKMSSDEQAVANTVKQRLQDLRGAKDIEVIAKKTIADLYEVVIAGESFVYTNKEVSFIMAGRLMEGKTLNDLTAISEAKYDRVDIKSLPLKNAIKVGKGKRIFYTFEDPRCGFCKKLAKEVSEMDDVAVYVFPVAFLGPESVKQAKSILCSKNPEKAWINTMNKNAPPTFNSADEKCEGILNENNSLARKLRVNGTPAIIFADGSRIKGYAPKDVIEARLEELASK